MSSIICSCGHHKSCHETGILSSGMKKEHIEGLAEKLDQFRKDRSYTDVTFRVEGVEFHCHKAVIAAVSPYFHTMFNSGLKESHQSVIELNDFQKDTFEAFIQNAYTGTFEITDDNVEDLVQVAHLLQVESMFVACELYLIANFHTIQIFEPKATLDYLVFVLRYGLQEFFVVYWANVRAYFKDCALSCSEDTLRAIDDQLVMLILDDDRLGVDSEDMLYKFVTRWINVDPENREAAFEQILPHLRLPFCSRDFLQDVIAVDPRMASPGCQKYLDEARDFHQCPVAYQHEIILDSTKPRVSCGDRKLWMVGTPVAGTSHMCSSAYNYHDNFHAWYMETVEDGQKMVRRYSSGHQVTSYDVELDEDGDVVVDTVLLHQAVSMAVDTLILTGGHTRSGEHVHESIAVKLDAEGDGRHIPVTKKLGHMLEGRDSHSSVLIDENLYIFGGSTVDGITNHAEKLTLHKDEDGNIVSCTAERLPDMIVGASHTMSAVLGKNIYIFGGYTGQNTLRTVQAFNTDVETWSLETNMPIACRDASAVRYNDKLFIVGGKDHICMSYNPSTGSWTQHKQPSLEHQNAPAVVWEGTIIVLGGEIGQPEDMPPYLPADKISRYCRTIEEYDPDTDEWEIWQEAMPERLCACHVFNIMTKKV